MRTVFLKKGITSSINAAKKSRTRKSPLNVVLGKAGPSGDKEGSQVELGGGMVRK